VASAKDAAEHVMIVDLMRNDLGRVAAYGTVEAAAEPDVEAHPGLWHLVTDVRARLRDGVGDGDIVRATFPPGSVTGAPKIQALKVISELEGTARAAYTGAIGFVSPLAGLELSVTIRTLEVGAGGRAWMGAGGGIVADSRPEAELREALGKARPVIEALGATVPVVPTAPVMRAAAGLRRLARPDPSLGVLETIAVAGGRALFVEEHLERLAASARALFGVALPADAGDRVVAAGAAAVARPGRPRVRVVLRADGSLEVTVAPRAGAAVPPDMVLEPCVLAGGLGPHKWADRSPMAGFEGLVCDLDGGVLEATSATVWLVEGDELVTPVADGRILPGTVRERVLAAPGLDARAEPIDFPRLSAADGLVVTSSIRIAAPAALAPGGGPTDAARRVAKAIRAAVGEESGVAIEAGEPV
jgi:para-aminobenzoate synthetase/4-amino-4-deoxychorismate lyase